MAISKFTLKTARSRTAAQRHPAAVKKRDGWLRRVFKLSNLAYVAIGYVIALITNILGAPEKIVNFQDNFPKARSYIYELAFSPEMWGGIFDSSPEFVVDQSDMNIVDNENAALEVTVVDGRHIDGRIWWDKACDLGILYTGPLIDGTIKFGGHSADVRVWDIVNGHKITFFYGTITQDDGVIAFSNFPDSTGLNGTRIAQNPEPATIGGGNDSGPKGLYCDGALRAMEKLGIKMPTD